MTVVERAQGRRDGPVDGGRPGRPSTAERRVGWLAFATMFVIGTDTFLVAPLLPVLGTQFDVDASRSGWLVSAYAVGYAICALVVGPISDRVDRRRTLLIGMAAFTVATSACALSWGFWPMMSFRFLAGVAAAVASPQVWASVPLLVRGDHVVKVMGRATAGLAIAQVAGIPIGAFLAAVSWRFSFIFVGVCAAAVTALLCVRFPPVRSAGSAAVAGTSGSAGRSGYALVFRSRFLVLCLIAYFVFQTGNFAAFSFIGSWLARDFHLTSTGIGVAMIIIGAGNAAGSLLGHRMVVRLGPGRSLAVGILAMAVGYATLVLVHGLVPAVLVEAIIMAAGGFVLPVMLALLQIHAGSARGTVSSLGNVAMYGGTTVGVAVAGPVFAATTGFGALAALAAAAFVVALGIYAASGALRGGQS